MPDERDEVTDSWRTELDFFEARVWPAFRDRGISKSAAWTSYQQNEQSALIDERLPAEETEDWKEQG
jgi:hypothetical protein